MTRAFVDGAIAGYGVAIPVGAIAILIMGLAARTSFRVGAAAALGVATADGLYAALAVAGGAALAGGIESVATPMRWIAAAVLLGLAVYTAVTALRRTVQKDTGFSTPTRAYGGLLALTMLNPMTIVYFGALVVGRQSSEQSGGPLFAVGAFLASASWQLLVAGGGRLVGRLLAGPRGRLVTSLASSALIVALAVTTLL
jgi:arginine exporter protein ArgO